MPERLCDRLLPRLAAEWPRLVAAARAVLGSGGGASSAVAAARDAVRAGLPRLVRAGWTASRPALYRRVLAVAGPAEGAPAEPRPGAAAPLLALPAELRTAAALRWVAGLDERSAARALGTRPAELRRRLEAASRALAASGWAGPPPGAAASAPGAEPAPAGGLPVLGLAVRPVARAGGGGRSGRPTAASLRGSPAAPAAVQRAAAHLRQLVKGPARDAWAALEPELGTEMGRLAAGARRSRWRAAAAAVALAAVLASPLGRPAREGASAIARRLGLGRPAAAQVPGVMGIHLDDPTLTRLAVKTTLAGASARARFPLQLPAWLPDGTTLMPRTPATFREYRRDDLLVAQEIVVHHPLFRFEQRALFDADGRLIPVPWEGLASYRRASALSAVQEFVVNSNPGVLELRGDRTLATWVAEGFYFRLEASLATEVVVRMARSVR